jgi:hypothetical protein
MKEWGARGGYERMVKKEDGCYGKEGEVNVVWERKGRV